MPDVFDTLNAALDAKDAPARPAWAALLELHVASPTQDRVAGGGWGRIYYVCRYCRDPWGDEETGGCEVATAARGWRDPEAELAEQTARADENLDVLQRVTDRLVAAESERAALALRVAALEGALEAVEQALDFQEGHWQRLDCMSGGKHKLARAGAEYMIAELRRVLAALRDGPPAIETEG